MFASGELPSTSAVEEILTQTLREKVGKQQHSVTTHQLRDFFTNPDSSEMHYGYSMYSLK